MKLVIKIAVTGIIVSVIHQVLSRSGRDEYAMLTVLAGILAVIAMLLPELIGLVDSLNSILDF